MPKQKVIFMIKSDKMNSTKTTTAQLIGLVSTSMYAGVMLCIGIGLGGYWLTIGSVEYAQMFQNIFLYLLPCIAITLLPGLVGVFKSYKAETNQTIKQLWKNSLFAIVVSIAITSFIALPLNFKIWNDSTSSSEIETLLIIWLIMHATRLAAAFIGVLYATKALRIKLSA